MSETKSEYLGPFAIQLQAFIDEKRFWDAGIRKKNALPINLMT